MRKIYKGKDLIYKLINNDNYVNYENSNNCNYNNM
jgi:hypothetical protein